MAFWEGEGGVDVRGRNMGVDGRHLNWCCIALEKVYGFSVWTKRQTPDHCLLAPAMEPLVVRSCQPSPQFRPPQVASHRHEDILDVWREFSEQKLVAVLYYELGRERLSWSSQR